MAVIDLGTFTDADADREVTTRVQVSDAGNLPPLPDAIAGLTDGVSSGWAACTGWAATGGSASTGAGEVLGQVPAPAVRRWAERVGVPGVRSDYPAYGFLYGDRRLSGPYRATPELMGCVLRAYGANEAPSEEVVRCHPDRLMPGGKPPCDEGLE